MFMPGARFLPGFAQDQDDAIDRRKDALDKQMAAHQKAAEEAFGSDLVDALIDVGVTALSLGLLASISGTGSFGMAIATALLTSLAKKHGIDPDDYGSPGETARPITTLTDYGMSTTEPDEPAKALEVARSEVSDPPESDTFDFAAMRSDPTPGPSGPPTDDPALSHEGADDPDSEALPADDGGAETDTGSPPHGTLFDVDEFALV